MTLRRFFKRTPREPKRYISQDILQANEMMLNNVFRVNEQVVDILRLLEVYAGDANADYEIARLSAFREVAIELAAYLFADEGDLLAEPVLDRFAAWLQQKIENGIAHGAHPATLRGYKTLALDLERRSFDTPKPIFP